MRDTAGIANPVWHLRRGNGAQTRILGRFGLVTPWGAGQTSGFACKERTTLSNHLSTALSGELCKLHLEDLEGFHPSSRGRLRPTNSPRPPWLDFGTRIVQVVGDSLSARARGFYTAPQLCSSMLILTVHHNVKTVRQRIRGVYFVREAKMRTQGFK